LQGQPTSKQPVIALATPRPRGTGSRRRVPGIRLRGAPGVSFTWTDATDIPVTGRRPNLEDQGLGESYRGARCRRQDHPARWPTSRFAVVTCLITEDAPPEHAASMRPHPAEAPSTPISAGRRERAPLRQGRPSAVAPGPNAARERLFSARSSESTRSGSLWASAAARANSCAASACRPSRSSRSPRTL
jgi:hypothetical protein